jgi:hypothetical protein
MTWLVSLLSDASRDRSFIHKALNQSMILILGLVEAIVFFNIHDTDVFPPPSASASTSSSSSSAEATSQPTTVPMLALSRVCGPSPSWLGLVVKMQRTCQLQSIPLSDKVCMCFVALASLFWFHH